jgi:hypothetical protein
LVCIVEGKAQRAAEPASNSAFAGPHKADKHQGTVLEGWRCRMWRVLLVHLHIVHTFGISMYSKRQVPASPGGH